MKACLPIKPPLAKGHWISSAGFSSLSSPLNQRLARRVVGPLSPPDSIMAADLRLLGNGGGVGRGGRVASVIKFNPNCHSLSIFLYSSFPVTLT